MIMSHSRATGHFREAIEYSISLPMAAVSIVRFSGSMTILSLSDFE